MNYELIDVHSAVDLYHLAAQAVGYVQTLLGGQFVNVLLEQVILQVYLLYEKLSVKNIGLIDIHVDSVILCKGAVVDVVLYGSYIVVDKKLLAQHITGEAPDTVVYGDDIGIEAGYQVVQRIKG